MRIGILGSKDVVLAAQSALSDIVFVRAETVPELLACVREQPIDAVWIDLEYVRDGALPRLRQLQRYSTVPLIVQGEFTSRFAELAVDLREWTNARLLVDPYDVDPRQVRAFVRALRPAHLRQAFLARNARRLAALPPNLEFGIRRMVEEPPEEYSVQGLGALSRCGVRWLGECCRSIGMRAPHVLFGAIMVLNGFAYACDPGFTLTQVAWKAGHRRSDRFLDLVRDFTGADTRSAFAGLSQDALMALVDGRVWLAAM